MGVSSSSHRDLELPRMESPMRGFRDFFGPGAEESMITKDVLQQLSSRYSIPSAFQLEVSSWLERISLAMEGQAPL